MKRLSSFSMLLFTFVLLFLTLNLAVASFASEALEIPYQVNNSDRIVIGTVSKVDMFRDHTIATITVSEWLYNPLPTETIEVRSERGTNIKTEVEVEFIQNESVLLMLNDVDLNKQLFRVGIGVPGKHPVSDRDAVIEELKAQGKWQGEGQAGNKTNETETIENTQTASKQEGKSNDTKLKSTPFISSFWVLAAVLGAVMYVRKRK